MCKVLIVEDEILARLGLRQLFEWNRYGFTLLPDAKDGEEALEMISKHQPEIILLDLNIPKMNGLQILEYLKQKHMVCKVIVISCNEEFEMVKDAMKLGAYDYLRKLNLSSEELLRILKRCREELDTGSGKEQKISPFVFHEIRYEEVISHSGRDIFQNVGTYRIIVCVMLQNQDYIYQAAACICEWIRGKGYEYLQILKGDQCCYFLLEYRFQTTFFEELLCHLKTLFPGKIHLGIREAVMRDVEDVNAAMVLAEQILIISYYDKEEGVYRFEEKIVLGEHDPRAIRAGMERLKSAVDNFEREQSEQSIYDIFKMIRGGAYVRVNVLRRIFMDMLGIYSMRAQLLGRAIEEIKINDDNCHYQKLMMMNSLCGIEEWFISFERIFYQTFLVEYKSSRSKLLKNVFAYIETHLLEPIHLSDAAREIGVAGTYLSTVFKREMGQNFIEYVNQRKVAAAKDMLEQGKLVYEVSEILGFENSTYFSKVFKRYEGISPDSYRRK